MTDSPTTQQELFFGEGFLEDHAGSIIREPRVAVIELIANAYDAGATEVKIEWPTELGGSLRITDNGSGMTKDEFDVRWKTLSYNRQESQGRFAENPNHISGEKRAVLVVAEKADMAPFALQILMKSKLGKTAQVLSAESSEQLEQGLPHSDSRCSTRTPMSRMEQQSMRLSSAIS
jgi:hypothetical protein